LGIKIMNLNAIKSIYLDYQATTPVDERVLESMGPFFNVEYGNPHSSDHWYGWQAKKAVDRARRQVADFIRVDPDEIIFTSGATEANNLVIIGSLNNLKKVGKNKLIVSAFEHKCVLECMRVAEQQGFEVIYLMPTKQGFIEPSSLEKIMDHSVGLVSVMMVNNEIGTVQPIKELATLTHRFGGLFHTDAAQAGNFIEVNNDIIDADLMSLSSHKIYGPKGIGALYIKRSIQRNISPIIYGGGQENGFRSGTLPTMLCVGFGEACSIASVSTDERAKKLRNHSSVFLKLLRLKRPDVILNGAEINRHPGNLNIQFPSVDAHSLIQALQPNVAASTGSACTTGTPEPSYVLKAVGLSDAQARSSLRFSFGWNTDISEIERAVEYILLALDDLENNA
jgi:cysteine desulfurase